MPTPHDTDKVAVITGGAGAIGSAIVSALASAGHATVRLDRAGEDPVDLADEHDLRRAAGEVLGRHGRVDVLVHAAAAFDRGTLDALDADTWRRMQAVNVEAALSALPDVRARHE